MTNSVFEGECMGAIDGEPTSLSGLASMAQSALGGRSAAEVIEWIVAKHNNPSWWATPADLRQVGREMKEGES
jgi:hypothetical protein